MTSDRGLGHYDWWLAGKRISGDRSVLAMYTDFDYGLGVNAFCVDADERVLLGVVRQSSRRYSLWSEATSGSIEIATDRWWRRLFKMPNRFWITEPSSDSERASSSLDVLAQSYLVRGPSAEPIAAFARPSMKRRTLNYGLIESFPENTEGHDPRHVLGLLMCAFLEREAGEGEISAD